MQICLGWTFVWVGNLVGLGWESLKNWLDLAVLCWRFGCLLHWDRMEIWFDLEICWGGDLVGLKIWFGRAGDLVGLEIGLVFAFS